MRSQVSDASEKIRALETRIAELQHTRRQAAEMAVGAVTPGIENASRRSARRSTGLTRPTRRRARRSSTAWSLSAVLLTSLALLPYIDGGGLIVAFAFIGIVQALDLVGRTLRGLVDLVRRTPSRALRE